MTDVKLAQNLTYLESGRAAKDYWRDLWRHRELLIFLVWRDIIVRYKQTVVGTSWVLIRPLLTMLVFTFVFGRVANLESGGVPYSLVVLSGLLPWTFFASALSDCSNSLVGNAHLISKIYFPRLIIPLSSVVVSTVEVHALVPYLHDLFHRHIEKITVVRDKDVCIRIIVQIVFQPVACLKIEVVRGLVEQQHVWFFQQQFGQ